MNPSVEYLFTNNLISFNQLLLNRYLELRLDEVDLVLLMHLYGMETSDNNFLSISEVTNKTSLEIDTVADRIDLLVTKGFISLKIVEQEGLSEEVFTLMPTLLKLIPEQKKPVIVNTKALVEILETELRRPLSSKEVQMIETWKYTEEQVKTAVLDALKQKKMGVEYVNKILENNVKEVAKDMSYFNQFLNE